jgi:hypothetical protein
MNTSVSSDIGGEVVLENSLVSSAKRKSARGVISFDLE